MIFEIFRAVRTGSVEDIKWAVASMLLALPIIILALSVHEVAHGYVAYKLGDNTAKNMGRLSLNPLKHLDPIGFLCMLLVGFGFAKPVPINSRYFKKPKRDMALTAIAGPVSNIFLALLFGLLLKIFMISVNNITVYDEALFNVLRVVYTLIYLGIQLNVALAVFNLIPIPPLDGSKILYMFLPPKALYKVMEYERYLYFLLLGLLAFGVLDIPLSFLRGKIINLIFFIFRI